MKIYVRFFYPVAILAIGMVLGGVAIAQEDVTTVEDPAFETLTRPVAAFNHPDHEALTDGECAVCHHIEGDDGRIVEGDYDPDFRCSDCHTASGDEDPRNLELVVKYHQRCKGCHEQRQEGPVVCSGCHVK